MLKLQYLAHFFVDVYWFATWGVWGGEYPLWMVVDQLEEGPKSFWELHRELVREHGAFDPLSLTVYLETLFQFGWVTLLEGGDPFDGGKPVIFWKLTEKGNNEIRNYRQGLIIEKINAALITTSNILDEM